MKYALYVTIIVLFGGCISSHNTTSNFPDPFEFRLTDSVASTKDSLFNYARRWMGMTLNNTGGGIKMHDRKRGKITATGLMGSTSTLCMLTCVPNNYSVQYTITFVAKDGEYKFAASNFVLTKPVSERDSTIKTLSLNRQKHPSSVNRIVWSNLKDDCYKNSQKLLESFKEYMRAASDVNKDAAYLQMKH